MATESAHAGAKWVPTKRTRFDNRKDEIVKAAGSLINLHGLRDTTLALVASEIGLNLKSLRYYFPKKEGLVANAFLESIALHRELVEQALEIEDFSARIKFFIDEYFNLKARIARKERPEFAHFGDIRALTEPYLGAVGAAYVEFFRQTRELFRPGEARWTLEQRNSNTHMLISQLLWSVIWIDGYIVDDYPRAAARLSDILLHGLAADPAHQIEASAAEMPTPFAETANLSQDSFLRAATQLINQKGYRGASVDRISGLLNVTKGAFYHHNETRDELVLACFERTFDIIRRAQDLAMDKEADGLAQVCAAATSLVSRQLLPEGEMLRTSALTAIGPDHRKEMAQRMSILTLRFADMLNGGLIDGSVRVCDMRIASETLTAMINSAQELPLWVRGATVGNAASLYVRPLVHGFLKSGQFL